MTRSLPRALAVLTGLMVVWGVSIPATKIALVDFPPLALTAARYLAALPCFLLVARLRPVPRGRDLAALAGLGLLGITAGQLLQSIGVGYTSASVATMLSATSPMFVTGFAVLILGQTVRARHILGMVIAAAGIAVVAWDPAGTAGASLLGNLIVLGSTASIAAYYVLGTRLIERLGALAFGAWTCLFGLLGLLPAAAWELTTRSMHPTWTSVAIILYLGALVTVAGLWIWLTMMRVLPARIVAPTSSMQPIFGIAASAWVLGEPLGLRFAAGALLVLGGIATTVWRGR